MKCLHRILPPYLLIPDLKKSEKKFKIFYFRIRRNTTLKNYRNIYFDAVNFLNYKPFTLMFANSFYDYMKNKYPNEDISFIKDDITRIEKLDDYSIIDHFRSSLKAVKATVSNNKNHYSPTSKIYYAKNLIDKPIYNLPRS